jgi:regulator of replication initiation timing
MHDQDEKELSRKFRDLQEENERLRIENKKLKKTLESISNKPASSLQAQGLADTATSVPDEQIEIERIPISSD